MTVLCVYITFVDLIFIPQIHLVICKIAVRMDEAATPCPANRGLNVDLNVFGSLLSFSFMPTTVHYVYD